MAYCFIANEHYQKQTFFLVSYCFLTKKTYRNLDLTAKCDELQNSMKRNMRISQIPEGKDTAGFVEKLLNNVLKLLSGTDIKIEMAHLTSKLVDSTEEPGSDALAQPRLFS